MRDARLEDRIDLRTAIEPVQKTRHFLLETRRTRRLEMNLVLTDCT